MVDMGIGNTSVIEAWLDEEWQYLKALKKELLIEILQMEYQQQLVNLWVSE